MKGEQQAKNANLLRAELRKQGINPDGGQAQGQAAVRRAPASASPPLDIAVFSRQIATMMQSGVPIVTSMEIIAGGQKNPRMTTLVNDIRDRHRERLVAVRGAEQASGAVRRAVPQPGQGRRRRPACWTPCSTPSRPTRKTSRPSRARSRRRCSTRRWSSRWRCWSARSCWCSWCRSSRKCSRTSAPTCRRSPMMIVHASAASWSAGGG